MSCCSSPIAAFAVLLPFSAAYSAGPKGNRHERIQGVGAAIDAASILRRLVTIQLSSAAGPSAERLVPSQYRPLFPRKRTPAKPPPASALRQSQASTGDLSALL